jgi:RNA-directed DNA polymerase
MYKVYRIPKKNGKYRVISEPVPELKAMQHAILEKLNTIPLMDCVHGFVPGRDIVSNAKIHQQQRYVLNIDIKDFFPSVKSGPMEEALKYWIKDDEFLDWVITTCFWEGSLPQGAPTSPVLANLYMANLDIILKNLCQTRGWNYSRYADDLTISGDDSLKEQMFQMLEAIDLLLVFHSLTRNQKKTKLMPHYQRQTVTGIVVNNERLTLSRKTKERLFQELKGRPFASLTPNEIGYLEHVKHVDGKAYEKLCSIMI